MAVVPTHTSRRSFLPLVSPMLTSVKTAPSVRDRHAAGSPFAPDRRAAVPAAPTGIAWQIKEAIERTAALVLLIALLPAFIIIALAILLESRGSVLFRQPRFGRGGTPFHVLKFRTMQHTLCDPTGAGQTGDADPRITRVGHILRKTSLDELPQLWNVVSGDMALIGPRAHPCGMCVAGLPCEAVVPHYHNRHVVRPGITGWAQVNGSRGAVKTADLLQQRLALDLDYIRNWSPWLDLRILWRTIWVVISRRQAR
jgi:polysaccharide biosynthesis protein PslA